jgi:hypothetical protein
LMLPHEPPIARDGIWNRSCLHRRGRRPDSSRRSDRSQQPWPPCRPASRAEGTSTLEPEPANPSTPFSSHHGSKKGKQKAARSAPDSAKKRAYLEVAHQIHPSPPLSTMESKKRKPSPHHNRCSPATMEGDKGGGKTAYRQTPSRQNQSLNLLL